VAGKGAEGWVFVRGENCGTLPEVCALACIAAQARSSVRLQTIPIRSIITLLTLSGESRLLIARFFHG